MLGHAAIFILFQLLESIEYSTLNLSSLLQVGVWAAPRVRSLPKKKKLLLRTLMRYLLVRMYGTLLELPGQRFCIRSPLKDTSKQFSKMAVTTYTPIRAA